MTFSFDRSWLQVPTGASSDELWVPIPGKPQLRLKASSFSAGAGALTLRGMMPAICAREPQLLQAGVAEHDPNVAITSWPLASINRCRREAATYLGRANGPEVNPRGQGPRAEAAAARRMPACKARDADGVTPLTYR